MRHIDILDRLDFHEFKVSVKASNVFLTMDAYRLLSQQIDNPLHLGVTEAGDLPYRYGEISNCFGWSADGRHWRYHAYFIGGRT